MLEGMKYLVFHKRFPSVESMLTNEKSEAGLIGNIILRCFEISSSLREIVSCSIFASCSKSNVKLYSGFFSSQLASRPCVSCFLNGVEERKYILNHFNANITANAFLSRRFSSFIPMGPLNDYQNKPGVFSCPWVLTKALHRRPKKKHLSQQQMFSENLGS